MSASSTKIIRYKFEQKFYYKIPIFNVPIPLIFVDDLIRVKKAHQRLKVKKKERKIREEKQVNERDRTKMYKKGRPRR